MKATNHPSDKMTIKNNNGDLLLEIDAEGVEEIKFKNGSKYTGREIDAAVAKAGTVPTVTEADAGKALVVDEEGKIVAGEAGGAGIVDDSWEIVGDLSILSVTVRKRFADFDARTAYKNQIATNCLQGKTLYQGTVATSDIPVLPVGAKLTFNMIGTVGTTSLGSALNGPVILGYGAQLYCAALQDGAGVDRPEIFATFTLNLS